MEKEKINELCRKIRFYISSLSDKEFEEFYKKLVVN